MRCSCFKSWTRTRVQICTCWHLPAALHLSGSASASVSTHSHPDAKNTSGHRCTHNHVPCCACGKFTGERGGLLRWMLITAPKKDTEMDPVHLHGLGTVDGKSVRSKSKPACSEHLTWVLSQPDDTVNTRVTAKKIQQIPPQTESLCDIPLRFTIGV